MGDGPGAPASPTWIASCLLFSFSPASPSGPSLRSLKSISMIQSSMWTSASTRPSAPVSLTGNLSQTKCRKPTTNVSAPTTTSTSWRRTATGRTGTGTGCRMNSTRRRPASIGPWDGMTRLEPTLLRRTWLGWRRGWGPSSERMLTSAPPGAGTSPPPGGGGKQDRRRSRCRSCSRGEPGVLAGSSLLSGKLGAQIETKEQKKVIIKAKVKAKAKVRAEERKLNDKPTGNWQEKIRKKVQEKVLTKMALQKIKIKIIV